MSYIFSSNGNNYTFKKLDNMLINMPEKDGKHVLVRETVDGVPQYSWTDMGSIVKVNDAYIFEHTPTYTEAFKGEWEYDLPSGSYLVTTTVTAYLPLDLFNECDSIESVVDKGYKVNVSIDGDLLLDLPFIDTLNNLVTLTSYALVEIGEKEKSMISASTNIPSLGCLGGVKSIIIVFEHLNEVVSASDSS